MKSNDATMKRDSERSWRLRGIYFQKDNHSKHSELLISSTLKTSKPDPTPSFSLIPFIPLLQILDQSMEIDIPEQPEVSDGIGKGSQKGPLVE